MPQVETHVIYDTIWANCTYVYSSYLNLMNGELRFSDRSTRSCWIPSTSSPFRDGSGSCGWTGTTSFWSSLCRWSTRAPCPGSPSAWMQCVAAERSPTWGVYCRSSNSVEQVQFPERFPHRFPLPQVQCVRFSQLLVHC